MDYLFSPMLTEKATARTLSVSLAALRKWRRQRRGPPFVKVEGCIRYDTDDLRRYLTQRTELRSHDNCSP